MHVVYGFMDLKTHCKLAMVVRKEGKKVRRYVHLGTGNYNPTTARVYTDLGLFTANKSHGRRRLRAVQLSHRLFPGARMEKAGRRAAATCNGARSSSSTSKPQRAREGKRSRIIAKLNSLVDRETIEALYQASQAGVPIDLMIRGICCLRPGLAGISENIRVRSIVDRFLEHSRILVFGEGQSNKCSSAAPTGCRETSNGASR